MNRLEQGQSKKKTTTNKLPFTEKVEKDFTVIAD